MKLQKMRKAKKKTVKMRKLIVKWHVQENPKAKTIEWKRKFVSTKIYLAYYMS